MSGFLPSDLSAGNIHAAELLIPSSLDIDAASALATANEGVGAFAPIFPVGAYSDYVHFVVRTSFDGSVDEKQLIAVGESVVRGIKMSVPDVLGELLMMRFQAHAHCAALTAPLSVRLGYNREQVGGTSATFSANQFIDFPTVHNEAGAGFEGVDRHFTSAAADGIYLIRGDGAQINFFAGVFNLVASSNGLFPRLQAFHAVINVWIMRTRQEIHDPATL